jgi:four helix bundle protein
MSDYRNLLVWQKAMHLAESVYLITAGFPRDERFGLSSQLRRAAVSVASNIAEGQGRGNDGHFIQFLGIARGSLHEVETQLILATRLGYLSAGSESELLVETRTVGRLTSALINSLDSSAPKKRYRANDKRPVSSV